MLTHVKRKLVWEQPTVNGNSNANNNSQVTIKLSSSKLTHGSITNSTVQQSLPCASPVQISLNSLNPKLAANHDGVFKTPSLPKIQPMVAGFLVPSTIVTTPPSSPVPGKRRGRTVNGNSSPLNIANGRTANNNSQNGKQLTTKTQTITIKSVTPALTVAGAGRPLYSYSGVFASGHSQEHDQTPTKAKHRYETSLGQLTKKFIDLLQKAPDGVLNLNDASSQLQVQKRRIYDITNVLEGVGLLHKTSKNNIQWKGGSIDGGPQASSSSNQNESTVARKIKIEMENAHLDAKEREIDELIEMANAELKSVQENLDHQKYAFVTYRDIRSIKEFIDQTVIAIKAPSETKLEVPDPRESLQIWLKSERGEIEVYLCPDDDGTLQQQHSDEGKGDSIQTDPMTSSLSKNKSSASKADEDPALKFAFISEDDDLGPMGSKSFLMQTEDQLKMAIENVLTSSPTSNLPFVHLEPPLSDEDYNFTLEDSEGIVDLFEDTMSLPVL